MMRRPIVSRPAGGLIGTMARSAVVAGTATAVSGRAAQNQATRAQGAADAEAYGQQSAAPPPPPPPEPAPSAPPVDVAGQLTQLAALRDQGVLTDAEFEAQKAKLLSA
jgi:hypothetical protein